jgi:tetratricopeptide (TPR) repeat protein
VYGAESAGHHLTNVLLHAANGVLLFLASKKMTGALWRSFIVAGLFALHPLRVESVAWISDRKDILSAFFGLMALWTYARYVEETKNQNGRPKLFYGLTLLCCACSLMSKAMLVTFPFVLLLLDYWPLERWRQKNKWSLLGEKIPFFALVIPVSVIAYIAQKSGGYFVLHPSLGLRLETVAINYPRYLLKMFWPADLSVLYPYPDSWPTSQLLLAIAFLPGVSVIVFALRRSQPCLLVGWLWYLGTLVPVVGFVPLGGQSMANHYTYFPMIGIVLVVVWLFVAFLERWSRRTVILTATAVLATVLCVAQTRGELVYWKDSATLWSRGIAVTQNNWMAHCALGTILGSSDQALLEFQKSVDINPDYADSQRGLASLLVAHNRPLDAIDHFQKAIAVEPQNSWGYHGLGYCLWQSGRSADAVAPLLKAVELDPKNPSYVGDLCQVIFEGGQQKQSISNFLQAAQADPKYFENFLRAAELTTSHADYLNNLAWAFATYPDVSLRNGHNAVRLATRACEITGDQVTVCVGTLAAAYAEDRRFDEAISTAEKAVALAKQNDEQDLLNKNHELLKLFLAHQAYHEPGKMVAP